MILGFWIDTIFSSLNIREKRDVRKIDLAGQEKRYLLEKLLSQSTTPPLDSLFPT